MYLSDSTNQSTENNPDFSPFRINDDLGRAGNPNSAEQNSLDLLVINLPVGTGMSFGEYQPTTSAKVGNEVVTFLLNLLDEHPDYRGREIVLTGSKTASIYVAEVARSIDEHNSGEG